MNSKKIFATALSCAMAATMLAGCGSSSSSSTASTADSEDEKITATITVWGPQEDQSEDNGKWLQTECDNFAKEHSNWDLTFKYGTCSEGDAGTNVSKDPEAAADVYMFASDQIGTLVDANGISKLGGTTLDQIKSQNTDAFVNAVTYEDAVYGVPYTGNTWFMYYDKDMLSEDDVKSLDTMMEKTTVAFPISNSWYIEAFYAAAGATFFGEDGQDEEAGIVLGDDGYKATQYIVNAVASGKLVDDKDGSGLANFGKSVGAFFSGSWDYQNAVDALGGDASKLGVAQLPTINIDGEDKQMKAFAGVKAVAVNPNTEYPEVANALAAYLGSKDAQQDHYDLRNIIPSDSSIDVSDDAMAVAQNDVMNNTSMLQPSFSEMAYWWTPAQTMGENIVNGKVTVDNAEAETETFETQANTESVN
jgi:arabinogalactan oligomer/maltooligosaccharide transport system substrate-binding protein